MDGMHRILVAGRNSSMSLTAAQDAAGSTPPADEGMELYTAYLHSRQAGEELLKAHIIKRFDKFAAEWHHTMAMGELSQLADVLGLDLVAREKVAAS